MRDKYLLPCPCGREIPVDATQSGEELICQCGQRLEVPTMRQFGRLKRAKRSEEPQQQPASLWGPRQAVLLIGLIVMAGGLGFAAYRSYIRPTIVEIRDMTPYQTWLVWHQELRPGIQQAPPWERAYLEGMKRYQRWTTVAWTIAGLGVVTMAASLLIPKKTARRRTQSESRRTAPGRERPS